MKSIRTRMTISSNRDPTPRHGRRSLRNAGHIRTGGIVLNDNELEYARLARNRLPKVEVGGQFVEVTNPVSEETVKWPRRQDEDAAGKNTFHETESHLVQRPGNDRPKKTHPGHRLRKFLIRVHEIQDLRHTIVERSVVCTHISQAVVVRGAPHLGSTSKWRERTQDHTASKLRKRSHDCVESIECAEHAGFGTEIARTNPRSRRIETAKTKPRLCGKHRMCGRRQASAPKWRERTQDHAPSKLRKRSHDYARSIDCTNCAANQSRKSRERENTVAGRGVSLAEWPSGGRRS